MCLGMHISHLSDAVYACAGTSHRSDAVCGSPASYTPVNTCTSEYVSEFISEYVSEYTSECVSEYINA